MSPYKRVDTTEQLERIAQAIRINPEITVGELKDLLGYAQEKSIYYWLKKSPYKGIRKFRQAVLTGQYNPGYPFPAEHLSQSAETPPRGVPLATGFSPQGQVETEGQLVPVFADYSAKSFAYRLKSNDYFPTFSRGDLLIVDPQAKPSQGSFVFVLTEEEPQIHRFYPGTPTLLVHPVIPNCVKTISTPDEELSLLGPVVQLVRTFI